MTDPLGRGRIATAGGPDARDLAGQFGHRHASAVRFADTDAMGHVNNAVYLTYVESARVAWWRAVTGEPVQREPGRAEGLILAEASIAYRSPVFHGEVVTVETRATSIGRTSVAMEHRLTAAGPHGPARLVAACRSTIVRYDYGSQQPTPLSAALIEAIEASEGRSLRD